MGDKKVLFLFIILLFTISFVGADSCGDGVCGWRDNGENTINCPEDCGPFGSQGVGELCFASGDCQSHLWCWGGVCCLNEEDCCSDAIGLGCGTNQECGPDYICITSTPEEPSTYCGDGTCDSDESCSSCSSAQKVTNFGTIKHTQSPKTWTIIVPKNYSKVEVAVYPYGKNVTNKYGGWNGSLKVNGKYVWKFKNFVKGKGGIIHDYLLGKEVLENSGKGSYCDVTGLAKSGSNKITYAHYGGGPGMGVKARITKKGTGGSSEKRTGGSYTSELVKFSNSMAKNKKYTNAGIVKIYDKNTIIKLFGSKVLKLANDAGFAGADLLKPSNWAKLYSKGPVKYFFNNNKDIMINVCLVAYTHSFSGYAGFVVVHTSSRGIDSYKVYALVYKQQFRKIGENGAPEFVRRPGWMKILIGNFSWHTLPAKFRKNLPNDMK